MCLRPGGNCGGKNSHGVAAAAAAAATGMRAKRSAGPPRRERHSRRNVRLRRPCLWTHEVVRRTA
eukprot:2141148-Alexandrium_andersonii.AAC.1